ncbi:MAG: transferase hexapeptide repeat containing protein [Cyanobacteria bacterium P01_D01_bin.123]
MIDKLTLEERIDVLERKVQDLQDRGQANDENEHWLDVFVGSLSNADESSFNQMVEYGRSYRESGETNERAASESHSNC